MSIVNEARVKVSRLPGKAPRVVRRADPRVARRDAVWLRLMRAEALTIRELADFLERPYATVEEGIRAAEGREAEAQAAAERAEAEGVDPEAIPGTGLDLGSLVYLFETYGPDAPLPADPEEARIAENIRDHPHVREFFARPDVRSTIGPELASRARRA